MVWVSLSRYFSALILVEGMDIESLHKYALDDRRELHQFAQDGLICQDMDRIMLTLGDIPHHAPVLLAWALLRHTLNPEETSSVVRKIGGTAIQLNVFQYLTRLLRSLASGGNDVRLHFLGVEHEKVRPWRTMRPEVVTWLIVVFILY